MNNLFKYKTSLALLTLSVLSLLSLWYLYFSKNSVTSSSGSVLGLKVVPVSRIPEYDIEFKDMDGQTKSIRSKYCEGYDITGKPGVTSAMKLTCNRNYYPEFYNNNYIVKKNEIGMAVVKGNTCCQVAVPIPTDTVTGYSYTSNIFTSYITVSQNFGTNIPKYRPVLESFAGRPIMFYYGGIHEINLKNNSTYLLSRFYDSAYYTRGFNYGNIPPNVYKVAGPETLYFINNTAQVGANFMGCYECGQLSISDGSCKYNNSGAAGTYCPGLASSYLSPELLSVNYSNTDQNGHFEGSYNGWIFRGDRNGYKLSTKYVRSYNQPIMDSFQLGVCDGTVACDTLTNKGKLYVQSKVTDLLPYTAGYAVGYRMSCIGKKNDGSCSEVIAFGARRDSATATNGPPPPMSSVYYAYINKNGKNILGCTNLSNSDSCFTGYDLLYDDPWSPFSNLLTGYEVPYLQFDQQNSNNCKLSGTTTGTNVCIRATNWSNNSGGITYYSSYLTATNNAYPSNYAKPANFPPNTVDYYFTNGDSYYAVDVITSSNSMDIYRFWIDTAGRPNSRKYSYTFNSASPMPKYIRKDEISATFTDKSYDIDIMFSSLNANPSNYASNELRIFRLVDGARPVNQNDPRLASPTSFTQSQTLVDSAKIMDITTNFSFNKIYPLTFRKFYEDGTKESGYPANSEYYVFVTREGVYHSAAPDLAPCALNLSSIQVVNTSPLSIVGGLDISSTNSATYKLSLNANKPIYCADSNGVDQLDKPITTALITFYDPLSNQRLASFPTTAIDNYQTLRFGGDLNTFLTSFNTGDKFAFDLNFSMGDKNIYVASSNFPTLFEKGYNLNIENKLDLKLSQDGNLVNFTSNQVLINVKKNNNLPVQLNLSGKTNPITLNSLNFPSLYYDHSLTTSTQTTLTDTISYQVCFPFRVLSASASDSNYLTVSIDTLNSRCVNAVYKNNSATTYTIVPQTLNVNIASAALPSVSNFEFNGNVFSNKSLDNKTIFQKTNKKFEGNFITSANITSNYKFINNSLFGMTRPLNLPSSLLNFNSISDFTNSTNFTGFNFFGKDINYVEANPIAESDLTTFSPNANLSSNFEIIGVSKGKGVLIDLTNENVLKNFDKYIFVNLDGSRSSRVTFKVDCTLDTYSTICVNNSAFNFKGALLGAFDFIGKLDTSVSNTKFIRIHENPDLLINLISSLRSKKYQMVSSSVVNLKYD